MNEVKRTHFFLSAQAVALLEVYSRPTTLLDEYAFFWEATGNDPCIDYRAEAKKLIANMQENECMGFIKALRDECAEIIDRWNAGRKDA